MEQPWISILMYAGDDPALFRRAVQSCIDQKYEKWQLLILEDNRSAGYKGLICYMAGKDDRIKAFSSDESVNRDEAVGILLGQTQGDYITILDPSDYYADESALGYVAESCMDHNALDVLIPGYDIAIEGDTPCIDKYSSAQDKVFCKGEINVSDILSKELIERGFCFIKKEFMDDQSLDFVSPVGGVSRTVVTAVLMSSKTLVLNKCICVLDKESVWIAERKKIIDQMPTKEVPRKIYLWGPDSQLKILASLVDKKRAIIMGVVFPDGMTEKPESMWGYPVFELSDISNVDYDYVLSMEGNVHEHVSSGEKTAVVSECIPWISFLISPDTYFSRRRMENAVCSGAETDGIITGISYAQRGLIPQALSKKMIMAAAPSQDMYYDKNLFFYLYSRLNGGSGIKYAVIALAPYEFRYDESKSAANCSRCLAYYDMVGRTHHYELDEEWILGMDLNKQRLDEVMSDGYIDVFANTYCEIEFKYSRNIFEFEGLMGEEKDNVMDNLRSIADKPYKDSIKENVGYLEDFLSFANANGVKIIILLPAFPGIFKEVFPREIINEEIEIIDRLREKYEFAFLNLYDDPDFDDHKHFADEDHLNVDGAMIMTRKLDEYLAGL